MMNARRDESQTLDWKFETGEFKARDFQVRIYLLFTAWVDSDNYFFIGQKTKYANSFIKNARVHYWKPQKRESRGRKGLWGLSIQTCQGQGAARATCQLPARRALFRALQRRRVHRHGMRRRLWCLEQRRACKCKEYWTWKHSNKWSRRLWNQHGSVQPRSQPPDLSISIYLVFYQSSFQVVLVRSKFAQSESIVDTVEEIVDVCLNRGSIGLLIRTWHAPAWIWRSNQYSHDISCYFPKLCF